MRTLSRFQNNLLTVGAILGGLCLLAAIAALLLGAKPLVFRSGSMAPAIPTGSLAISIPAEAASIRAGDVISVETATGVRITHRVVSAGISGDTATVTLKGDANSVPDAAPYVLHKADRVVAHAPLLGYAVAWLSSSAAVFAGGLFTAYLLYLAFGPSSRRRPRREASEVQLTPDTDLPPGGHRAEQHGRRATRLTAMSIASLSILTGTALHSASPSKAAFSDAGSGTSNFSAAQLPVPTLTCKQGGSALLPDNTKVELTWLHNNGPVGVKGYELTTQIGSAQESTGGSYDASTTALTMNASSINSSSSTPVTVRIYSTYFSWRSPAGSAVAHYKPPQMGGIVPATLTC
jgi:signal peptidase